MAHQSWESMQDQYWCWYLWFFTSMEKVDQIFVTICSTFGILLSNKFWYLLSVFNLFNLLLYCNLSFFSFLFCIEIIMFLLVVFFFILFLHYDDSHSRPNIFLTHFSYTVSSLELTWAKYTSLSARLLVIQSMLNKTHHSVMYKNMAKVCPFRNKVINRVWVMLGRLNV